MEQLTILTTDDITPQNLAAALEAIHDAAPLKYLLVDWWNAPGLFGHFTPAMTELKTKWGDCVGGGAFGDAVDVSWRQVGEKFRAVLVAARDVSALTEATKASGIKWESCDGEAQRAAMPGESFKVILWGTKCADRHNLTTSSKWVEGRIPRELVYPVKPAQMQRQDKKKDYEAVMLTVTPYYDERGRPVIYRRHGLSAQLESVQREEERQKRGVPLPPEADEAPSEVTSEGDKASETPGEPASAGDEVKTDADI